MSKGYIKQKEVRSLVDQIVCVIKSGSSKKTVKL